jgi:hypothetical protein
MLFKIHNLTQRSEMKILVESGKENYCIQNHIIININSRAHRVHNNNQHPIKALS